MIQLAIIYYQKPVVYSLDSLQIDVRILSIIYVEICLKLRCDAFRVNGRSDIRQTLA